MKHLTRKIKLKNVTGRFDVTNIIFKSEKFISFKFVKRVEVNSASFSNEKTHNEAFWGVYFVRIREKTLG